MLRKTAMVIGIVFLILGIGGYLPFLVSDGKLLGIFLVDSMTNVVHILTGLVFLAAAQKAAWSRLAFQVIGVVYALVTILGFMAGNGGAILGLLHVNTADNILHLLLTVVFLYLGFGTPATHRDADAPAA